MFCIGFVSLRRHYLEKSWSPVLGSLLEYIKRGILKYFLKNEVLPPFQALVIFLAALFVIHWFDTKRLIEWLPIRNFKHKQAHNINNSKLKIFKMTIINFYHLHPIEYDICKLYKKYSYNYVKREEGWILP